MSENHLQMRRYVESDRPSCLQVFDSNRGEFFTDDERVEFDSFLMSLDDSRPYFVVLEDQVVVACGGHGQFDGKRKLCWGMVHKDVHGKGVGEFLLAGRLSNILDTHGDCAVSIDTSQLTEGFYAKFGFVVTEVVKAGYAPDLDKVSMTLARLTGVNVLT